MHADDSGPLQIHPDLDKPKEFHTFFEVGSFQKS